MAFNKMFIMLPLMYLVRKLDAEDDNVVFLLRCAYFGVQSIIVVIVLYIYMQATKLGNGKHKDVVIYVPMPVQPFADPKGKKQFKQIAFGKHVIGTARSLVGSTLFGIALTAGLHFYKGMIVGIAMQAVMGPFNLYENSLVMAFFLKGKGGSIPVDTPPQSLKMFDEKYRADVSSDDEVVDEEGKIIFLIKPPELKELKAEKKTEAKKSFDDLLLDTWDEGADANIQPLMNSFTKKNINYKTRENQWTPIMIMAAIGVMDTKSAMKKMKELGANPSAVDEEGWNALHWAAFHGSKAGAESLMEEFDAIKTGLHLVKDKEGKTALEHARAEKNFEVVKVIENAVASAESSGGIAEQDGIRNRK